MAYLSLYRKYRPRSFAEIVGQRHVTQTLANAVKADRIAHAYLFCGPRGTGKTSTALVLAMALNCEKGPTPEPCGQCELCRRIIAGSALDVFEFDAASHRGVEEITDVLQRVGLAPAEARIKVYIIDEVHMLSDHAFNAFLKTLEEPPAHVVFVLATTEPHRVLPTILSRCQRFDFHRVGAPDIEATVRRVAEKEGIAIDDKAISMLAQAADGSVRDALTLLEQAYAYAEKAITPEVVTEILGGVDFGLLAEFADIFQRGEVAAALNLVDRVVAEGKDLRQVVGGLISHYRNLLVLCVDRRGRAAIALPEESVARLAEQAKAVRAEEVVRVLDLLAEMDRELRFTSQPRLLLELLAVRVCRGAGEARAAAPASAGEVEQVREGEEERREEAREKVAEAGGAVELGDLKRRWDEVLAHLRKTRQGSVVAFLREAAPAAYEEGVVTLEFNHQFHYDQMARNEKRCGATAKAIGSVFGIAVSIKCRVATDTERPGAPAEPKEIQRYLSMFPGSELEE